MKVGDIFYRAVDVDLNDRRILYTTYVCVKVTPKGGWVRSTLTRLDGTLVQQGKPKFMTNWSNFAHPSKPLAIDSLRLRTAYNIHHLERRLAEAKERERVIRKRRLTLIIGNERPPFADAGDVMYNGADEFIHDGNRWVDV